MAEVRSPRGASIELEPLEDSGLPLANASPPASGARQEPKAAGADRESASKSPAEAASTSAESSRSAEPDPPAFRAREGAEAEAPVAEAAPSYEAARRISDDLVARARQAAADADRRAAMQLYRDAFEIAPHNPHASAGLARIFLEAGNPRAALPWAERAARLRARRPEYQRLLTEIHERLGD